MKFKIEMNSTILRLKKKMTKNNCTTNMAQLPNQQGFPFNHQPVGMVQQQFPQSVGNLKGSGARRATGSLIIACGCFQLFIANSISGKFYGFNYSEWGLLNGVFAIVTGSFGLASAREKCMVITYMVLDIIATVSCVLSCGFHGLAASDPYSESDLHILICLSFGLQFLFCIIGASFTCGALSGGVPQQKVLAYQPCVMLQGQAYVVSPCTGAVNMAMQPAQVNVDSVNEGPPTKEFATAQPNITQPNKLTQRNVHTNTEETG